MDYDTENIFAKILAGEIPCKKITESEYSLSFFDINPQAPQHALVIPKGQYTTLSDFAKNASAAEMADWIKTIGAVADKIGVTDGGYRVLVNAGANASQEVPHLHAHIVGGAKLGKCFP